MSAFVESSINQLFSQAFKRKENVVAYLSSGMLHLIFPLLSLNTLLVTTTKETLWLGQLCNDLGFPQADPGTLLLIIVIISLSLK
jgi:hypothetical protein